MNRTQEEYLERAIRDQEGRIEATRTLIMRYTASGNESERSAYREKLVELENELERMKLYNGHKN